MVYVQVELRKKNSTHITWVEKKKRIESGK